MVSKMFEAVFGLYYKGAGDVIISSWTVQAVNYANGDLDFNYDDQGLEKWGERIEEMHCRVKLEHTASVLLQH